MILLSPLALAGCSSDPRLEADRAIQRANEEIAAHDRLFDEARNAYSEARRAVREGADDSGEITSLESTNEDTSGGSTSGGGTGTESISQARSAMEDARERLQSAREEIAGIRKLEVSGELSRYSRALEEALSAQIRAEEREIAFYELLQEDPTLQDNRDRATELLSEARDAYEEAESGYKEARQIADSNPRFAAPESGSGG